MLERYGLRLPPLGGDLDERRRSYEELRNSGEASGSRNWAPGVSLFGGPAPGRTGLLLFGGETPFCGVNGFWFCMDYLTACGYVPLRCGDIEFPRLFDAYVLLGSRLGDLSIEFYSVSRL